MAVHGWLCASCGSTYEQHLPLIHVYSIRIVLQDFVGLVSEYIHGVAHDDTEATQVQQGCFTCKDAW